MHLNELICYVYQLRVSRTLGHYIPSSVAWIWNELQYFQGTIWLVKCAPGNSLYTSCCLSTKQRTSSSFQYASLISRVLSTACSWNWWNHILFILDVIGSSYWRRISTFLIARRDIKPDQQKITPWNFLLSGINLSYLRFTSFPSF